MILTARSGHRLAWFAVSSIAIAFSGVFGAAARAEDARMEYARQLLKQLPEANRPALKIDASLNHPEAFSLRPNADGGEILGGGPGGALYGAQQWLSSAPKSPIAEKPDFELRGTVLYLMKDAAYNYQLSPKEFPWFFDRPLLIKYLDYLQANRFNTVFLWTAHLYPSIVPIPGYPDATDMSAKDVQRNRKQFSWFTHECAKRNISVLLHMYNIFIPKPLAKSRKVREIQKTPTEFTKKYTKTAILQFLKEFDSVGLYVCPGEYLEKQYQAEWIRDVIISAAKESGHNPRIVVRDWSLDADGFRRLCVGQYDNLYTELKHNWEGATSPVPDPRHAGWKKVAKKHIVNFHELTDLKPFRWGCLEFVREMVGEWKKAGLDGAEIMTLVTWRWPYSLDKMEPQQKGFWPEGKKLLTFERDAIYLELLGRYLWKADRPHDEEVAFWTERIGERFGSRTAGELLLKWYDVTGPIMPCLENNWQTIPANSRPTAVARRATIDWLLRHSVAKRPIPTMPTDTYLFERYKKKYAVPGLTNRIVMPVTVFADDVAISKAAKPTGDETPDPIAMMDVVAADSIVADMTPDKMLDLLVEMAEEGVKLAEAAKQAAAKNQDEAGRFVTDSQALLMVTRIYRERVFAAIARRCFDKSKDVKYLKTTLEHLRQALAVCEKLVALTDKTYINPQDMIIVKKEFTWHGALDECRSELAGQEALLAKVNAEKPPKK